MRILHLNAKQVVNEETLAERVERENMEGVRLNRRGIQLAKDGKYQEAEAFFREAIKVSPALPSPKISICNILFMQYKFDEAEILLKEVLRLPLYREEKETAYYMLGTCYYHLRKYDEAIELYEAAKTIQNIPCADIHYMLAGCYENLGEWEKAVKEIKQAEKSIIPPNADIRREDIAQAFRRISSRAQKSDIKYELAHFTESDCSKENLNQNTATELSQRFDLGNSKVFFVGAGISNPSPSNLPYASQILREIFQILFKIDKVDICEIYKLPTSVNPNSAYETVAQNLTNTENLPFEVRALQRVHDAEEKQKDQTNTDNLPFEASFRALMQTVGYPAIRFVDTLRNAKPNLNHYMLAHAIKHGHLVVTVNFDELIEKAYEELFPNEQLKIIITDSEFQKDLENEQILGGKLVKIHGTAGDYNSVVLTLEAVVKVPEDTLRYNKHIKGKSTEEPFNFVYPSTTLSPPKALFLQKALQNAQAIFMGYSDSDIFDIKPILDDGWKGLWIDHSISEERFEKDDSRNIRLKIDTSKVTSYFMQMMGVPVTEYNEKIIDHAEWPNAFKAWIDRLRLVEGDGLFWLGKLNSVCGKWEKAAMLYMRAADKYKIKEKEIAAKINYAALSKKDDSNNLLLAIGVDIKNYNIPASLKSPYAMVLLNRASNLLQADDPTKKVNEAKFLIQDGLKYAKESGDPYAVAYGYELFGDVMFSEESFQEALNWYEESLRITSLITGDIISMIGVLIASVKCLLRLNQEDAAINLLDSAVVLAGKLKNEKLVNYILSVYHRELKWRSDLHLEIRDKILKEIPENFKNVFEKDMEECDQLFFKLHIKYSIETYMQLDEKMHILLKKYERPSIKSYLCLTKSSIAISHYHMERRVRAICDLPLFEFEIEKLYSNFAPATYDGVINKMDILLGKYKIPSVQAYLFFFKSNIYRRKADLAHQMDTREELRKQEIEMLQQYAKIQPDDPLVEHNLGVAYMIIKKYDLAEKHFLKAIELLEGWYPLAIYNLSRLYLYHIKDFEKARIQRAKLKEMGVPDSWLSE